MDCPHFLLVFLFGFSLRFWWTVPPCFYFFINHPIAIVLEIFVNSAFSRGAEVLFSFLKSDFKIFILSGL